MPNNHPQEIQATGYRHRLAFADGGLVRLVSYDWDGNYNPVIQQQDGLLILPFGVDRQVLAVFRDEDGNFFTENPLLRGPYARREDVFRAASHLFRDRTQTPLEAQGGRPNRPRRARPVPLLGLTRYGRRTLPRRSSSAHRSLSPVVAEDLQPPRLPSIKYVGFGAASAAPSAQTAPHNSTSDGTPPLGRCYSASSGPTIWYRRPRDWYFRFFIRMDRGGAFHMYPDDLGGPFRSLKEVDAAIDCHLENLQRQAMCSEKDDISFVERMIRRSVFYPDGTPRRGPNSLERKFPNDFHERHLVQAILDQYNDDHNLVGDLAHELIGDVIFRSISEDTGNYYHFNFSTKVKEAGDTCNLFFAEAVQTEIDGDWVVSCCCMIKPNDDGSCYGCSRHVKHPKSADAYIGGHAEDNMGFGGDSCSDSDDDVEAQIAKLRIRFKGVLGSRASLGAFGAQAPPTAGEPMESPESP